MTFSRFQATALGISGVTALAIGAFIFSAPQAFYHGYGIELGDSPDILSEMRAPGACLAFLGAIMLWGLIDHAKARISVWAAFCVFLAFPLGRLVSLVVDGLPGGGILGALAVEIAIAMLLILAFGLRRAAYAGMGATSDA